MEILEFSFWNCTHESRGLPGSFSEPRPPKEVPLRVCYHKVRRLAKGSTLSWALLALLSPLESWHRPSLWDQLICGALHRPLGLSM